ncbi:MAG: PDZ domain-containing protein, partial [Acidobacteria bacterium]|nr:PDZ domain-containing protein [Acidobacteriota bacterium]
MRLDRLEIRMVLLTTLSLFCAALAVVNLRDRNAFRLPSDGVVWEAAADGLVARTVVPGGPAEAAGLKPGDILITADQQAVRSAEQVTRRLYDLGVGRSVHYHLLRSGTPLELGISLAPEIRPATVRAFLRLVGVVYLLLGLFVLWRRLRAARALHFALYCLASFVLFAYSYTGEFTAVDWTVYWMNVAAMLLQPALFAHFCLSYPLLDSHSVALNTRRRWLLAIYGSAGALGLTHLGVAFGVLRFAAPLAGLRDWLDRMEMGYLAAMYILGMGLLASAFRSSSSRLLRKQIGWVLGGAVLGLAPFTLVYGIPFFLGVVPNAWMNLSAFSLVLLPLGIAYSIARHRLLEVEVALGRGVAYALATGALVGLYFGLAAVAGDLLRQYIPGGGTAVLVLAVIATGLLFHPMQRWIQSQLDRRLLRHRYDYREALLRFGRELSAQTELDRMIGSLLSRLTGTLEVPRAAVFIASGQEPGSFRLRGMAGLEGSIDSFRSADFSFLHCFEDQAGARAGTRRDRLFFSGWGEEINRELGPAVRENPDWKQTIGRLELSYYYPCRTQNRLVAVLALGTTAEGELLSEEDAALVETLAGYLAAAIENVGLLESLAAKAKQYEDLQQFSENILESINVGLLAVDLEDRVQAMNTPLELMMPMPFRQSRGRHLNEIFPPELMAEFERSRDDAAIHTIYRYRARLENGQEKVLNVAIAPLLSKSCEWIGRLVIFDDVTDRVALESQLAQAEKLSSVGLLAAGVAHEVNTPLTVISTQAQMLAKQLTADDKNFKVVEKIIRQTFRASEIVNSLLNFSRTKGTSFSAVEMNKVISETLLLLDHQLKTARVAVESHLEPGLPFIHGNADKLQQVFLNLFLNSLQAMNGMGRLEVATALRGSELEVSIADNGAGIAPKDLPHIFEPFYTTKTTGTGLGLAVVHGIIKEHGGRINVESQPGQGTTMRLHLPIA